MVTVHLALVASTPIQESMAIVGLRTATTKLKISLARSVDASGAAVVASKEVRGGSRLLDERRNVGIVVTTVQRLLSSTHTKVLSNSEVARVLEGLNRQLMLIISAMNSCKAKDCTKSHSLDTKLIDKVSKLSEKRSGNHLTRATTNCKQLVTANNLAAIEGTYAKQGCTLWQT